MALLRTWIVATAPQDDALLILKLTGDHADWQIKFMLDVSRLEQSIGKSREAAAPITFYEALLSDPQMARLFATATHYWMNSLQGVSDRENYFVSINRPGAVASDRVVRRINYEHPLFSLGVVRAQAEIPAVNAAARGGLITVRVSGPDRKVLPGFDHGACVAFRGDATAAAVAWKGKSLDELKGKPIRLEFFLQDADLYSFRAQGP